MRKSISRFNRMLLAAGMALGTIAPGAGCSPSGLSASETGYRTGTAKEATEGDERWAEYLYGHLRKRVREESLVTDEAEKKRFEIVVRIDSELPHDFRVERTDREIRLTARDDEKMLWLQYQLMKRLGDVDPRIATADLPPALLSLNDTCGDFGFEYRGVYTAASLHPDYPGIAATDNADGWGLWGHQLGKALGKNAPEAVYATVNGMKYPEQFCFSAEETYRRIERYIEERFGAEPEAGVRFMIAPNDDPAVCTCPGCRKAGNTPESATGAVTRLIARLADRFPGHRFFALSYLSAEEAPSKALPPNAGVMLSAIDLPLSPRPTGKAAQRFTDRLDRWKKATPNLYVWDYVNNFDDYLTPFPVLGIARNRLLFFRDHGITGVFLNGNGADYAPFDDLRTFVLSALLIDPNQSEKELAQRFLGEKYPVSKNLLFEFYSELEERALSTKKALNLYGSIRDAEQSFLDADRFVVFYDRLSKTTASAKGDERKKLHLLLTALSYTRMELARAHAADRFGYAIPAGNRLQATAAAYEWADRLKEHRAFPGMRHINESGYPVDGYLEAWNRSLLTGLPENLLQGTVLRRLSEPDEGYSDLSVLTDGTPGLPDSYHYGWLIASKTDLELTLPAETAGKARTFRMTFLNQPRYRIEPPVRVELYKDGQLYQTFYPKPANDAGNVVAAEGPVDLAGTETVTVKAVRPTEGKRQIAADELYLIP